MFINTLKLIFVRQKFARYLRSGKQLKVFFARAMEFMKVGLTFASPAVGLVMLAKVIY